MKKLLFLIPAMILLVLNIAFATQQQQQDLYESAILIWFPSVNLTTDNSSTPHYGTSIVNDPEYTDSAFSPIGDAAAYYKGDNGHYTRFEQGADEAPHYLNSTINQSLCVLTNFTTSGNPEYIFSTGKDGVDERWRIGMDATNLRNYFITDTGSITVDVALTTQGFNVNTNWTMLCFTIEVIGNTVNVSTFINSTNEGSGKNTNGYSGGMDDDLYIGARSLDLTNGFKGGLNALYYFNKTLTQSDITLLFNNGDFFELLNVTIFLSWAFPTESPSYFTNNSIIVSLDITSDFRNRTEFRLYDTTHQLVDSVNVTDLGTGNYFYNHTFDTSTFTQGMFYVNATHYGTKDHSLDSTTLEFTISYFNLTFFDEITESIMTDKVELEVVGDKFAQNYTTENGKIGAIGWGLEEYRLSYTSDKYRLREYYFTLTNITNASLDLYMLSTDNGTDVTFTVQDTSGNELDDATIYLKKYYVSTNSYRTVAMARTNEEGGALIDVDFNDAFYQILVTYGTHSLQTIGARIISTTRFLTIDLIPSPFGISDAIDGVTTSLSFNNVTQTFSYTFVDTNGIPRIATLEVWKTSPTTSSNVCTATDTSVSGTLLCTVNTTDVTGTYTAKGYISINPKLLTDTYQVFTGIVKEFRLKFGTQGIFLTILLSGVLAGLGAVVSPAVGIIMFMVGIAIASFMGMSLISMVFLGFLILATAIIIFRMKR